MNGWRKTEAFKQRNEKLDTPTGPVRGVKTMLGCIWGLKQFRPATCLF